MKLMACVNVMACGSSCPQEIAEKMQFFQKMAIFVLALRVTERLEKARKHASQDPQNREENQHATFIVISKGFCDFDVTLLT